MLSKLWAKIEPADTSYLILSYGFRIDYMRPTMHQPPLTGSLYVAALLEACFLQTILTCDDDFIPNEPDDIDESIMCGR